MLTTGQVIDGLLQGEFEEAYTELDSRTIGLRIIDRELKVFSRYLGEETVHDLKISEWDYRTDWKVEYAFEHKPYELILARCERITPHEDPRQDNRIPIQHFHNGTLHEFKKNIHPALRIVSAAAHENGKVVILMEDRP
ncbi:hypothetical protein ADM98_11585 [Exiguobacterium sp. BMC-KP]|uniref:hypothetical protein n=1 Tax=Exiguobacterium sp. BMC-KP TaxID=1684312 RepID=UPI0006AA26F3|nr:hypothetical protein [Exiguobacterium sp. BMC-KP]KOP29505.1 hypothetical protein ADM98_11585 [Exiguobacterium sp. BMC-KP]